MDRLKKLEIDLQREISFIINSKIKDPRLGFITITGVRLSSDFHYLNIYISVMDDENKIEGSLDVLKKCEGFIKNNIKNRIKLRTMPDFKFIYDNSINKGMKISEIIEDLKKTENG
ncbi:MAG: 30S ribosome-binding factor RbfA [Actinobacteria bacterium]|nr:30S ribosome-binding factor RbfA [Actinomycetota bacterium]